MMEYNGLLIMTMLLGEHMIELWHSSSRSSKGYLCPVGFCAWLAPTKGKGGRMEITNFQKDLVEATTGVIYRLLTELPVSDDEAARILKGFMKTHPPQKNAKAGDVITITWP